MKYKEFKTQYELTEGGLPELSIIYGDAQIGASVVHLDDLLQGKGNIGNLVLQCSDYNHKGKKLIIKSIVTDINDSTSHTSVKYILRKGSDVREYVVQEIVDNDGDSIIYRTEIEFV